METNTNDTEAKQPASAGCHPTTCSPSSDTPLTDFMVEMHVFENKNHPATDWVPASYMRQMEVMLRAMLKTARQGRYTAVDYVAVGRQFDAVDAFLENVDVETSPPKPQ